MLNLHRCYIPSVQNPVIKQTNRHNSPAIYQLNSPELIPFPNPSPILTCIYRLIACMLVLIIFIYWCFYVYAHCSEHRAVYKTELNKQFPLFAQPEANNWNQIFKQGMIPHKKQKVPRSGKISSVKLWGDINDVKIWFTCGYWKNRSLILIFHKLYIRHDQYLKNCIVCVFSTSCMLPSLE